MYLNLVKLIYEIKKNIYIKNIRLNVIMNVMLICIN